MPELPEVETVRRGIEPHVVGRTIERVWVREPRLRWPVPRDFADSLSGRRIAAAGRRAKYLVLTLEDGDRLLIHLGMSGRLFVLEPDHPLVRHDHVDFLLHGGSAPPRLLRFHDPRRFGAVLLWPRSAPGHVLLDGLGPEPFDAAFNGDYLYQRSRGRSAPLKNFIMDGRIVVGAGNIYAAEALFRAGLRPGRAAGRVGREQYRRLAEAIREVLGEAIRLGGTTVRDFAGADGASGYFQQALFVYGRENQPCRRCGSSIRRRVIGARSSFYCPRCQP
jgi:formamidopyrimidine-DNA glycosylase